MEVINALLIIMYMLAGVEEGINSGGGLNSQQEKFSMVKIESYLK